MKSILKKTVLNLVLLLILLSTNATFAIWVPQENEDVVELYNDLHQKIVDEIADAENYYQYASMQYHGFGCTQTYVLARKYFLKAANLGHRESMYDFACMCFSGKGGFKNLKKARDYFKKAADLDHYEATHAYACMCYEGKGGIINDEDAFNYFEKSSKYSDDFDQSWYNYAQMCYQSEYKHQNYYEASKYFKKMADKGNVNAMYNYGSMCFNGDLDPKNPDEAIKYLSMAASYGDVESMYNLGLVQYYRAKDGQCGFEISRNIFKKAADHGHEKANEMNFNLDTIIKVPNNQPKIPSVLGKKSFCAKKLIFDEGSACQVNN